MRQIIFIFIVCFNTYFLFGQVAIGTTNPDESAVLELKSTNKGFLPPRMTEFERNTINNPAEGLFVFCTDCCGYSPGLSFFNGTEWINNPGCFDRSVAVGISGATAINSDGFLTFIGTDRKLYTWGRSNSDPSATTGSGEALGANLPLNGTINRKPTPIVLANPADSNVRFIQIATGYLGSSIALTRTGDVYGAGLTDNGSGNLGNPNSYTKINFGTPNITVKLIGSSEGGSIAITDDDKAYFWGYVGFPAFLTSQSNIPNEISLPVGVLSDDIIAIGGSYHYFVIFTSSKIYFTGYSLPWESPRYDGSWYEYPETYSNINKVSVSRNIITLTDDNGSYYITSHSGHTALDFSALDPVVKLQAGGINKTIFAITADKIYYKIAGVDFSSPTEINIPSGYTLIDFISCRLASGRYVAKLKKDIDGTIHYFGGKTDNQQYDGLLLGDFTGVFGQLKDLGLDLSLLPSNVEFEF